MKNIIIIILLLLAQAAVVSTAANPAEDVVRKYAKDTYGTNATVEAVGTVQCVLVKLKDSDSGFVCDYLFKISEGHYPLYSLRINNERPQLEISHKFDEQLMNKLFSEEALKQLRRYDNQYVDYREGTSSADPPYLYIKHLRPLIHELQNVNAIYFSIIPMKMEEYSVETNVKVSRGRNVTELSFYASESGFPIYVSLAKVEFHD